MFRLLNVSDTNIKSFISTFLLLSLCGLMQACSMTESQMEKPLNILFVLTDDQAPDTLSAFGNEAISTPNLDQLVSQGTTFTHVFNQGAWSGAVCLPSRQMINTGRHLYRTGLDARGVENVKYAAKHKTFGQVFKDSGYDTFQTGKWHLSMDVWNRSFSHGKAIHQAGMSRHEKGGHWFANFTDFFINEDGDTSFVDYKGKQHSTEVIANAAIDFLSSKERHDKPFMMYVGFLAPHDPLHAPQSFLDKHPAKDMALPNNYLAFHPFDQGDYYLRDEVLSGFPRNELEIKQHRSKYYAMIEHTDEQIGRILTQLKTSGLADNTLVVFTSDHGLAMGSHGLMGKQNQYDHSVRVPFVISGPNVPKNKQATGMFYLNSVYPTAVEMAGLEIPASVDAPSITPLIYGQKDKVYDTIFGAYRHYQRMLRSEEYKLIYYPMLKRTQLFNLSLDPDETNDLSLQPQHQGRIQEMMTQLIKWQEVVEDPLDFAQPEASYDDFLRLTWD